MRILAVEPYATTSHRLFLEGLARSSRHEIVLDLSPARAWRWRMRTASLAAARRIERGGPFDLVLASDYLDLAATLAILPPRLRGVPAVAYFHENQLTYPPLPGQEGERGDVHLALVHVNAILAAERALFNSHFHRRELLGAARSLLGKAPDVDASEVVARLAERSDVLPLGTDVPRGEPSTPAPGVPPVVLWPHRWEHDKAPELFLAALDELDRRHAARGGGGCAPLRLLLCGQRFRRRPAALDELERRFADRIVASGFRDRDAYLEALRGSHVVVSAARHEFFGVAVLEAIRAGALPVLPDRLAYPELVGPEHAELALYGPSADGAGGLADALERALRIVARGERLAERRALARGTDRCAWSALAPRFDAVFEEVAGRAGAAEGPRVRFGG